MKPVISNSSRVVDPKLGSTRKLITGLEAGAPTGAALTRRKHAEAHGTSIVANVRDFGAAGDGVTDDTTAIRNAFASSYDVVYFPAGRYLMTGAAVSGAALTRTGKTLIIHGDGPAATQLIWQPSADDISDHLINWYTSNTNDDTYHRLEVRDITLKADKNVGTAIFAEKAAQSSRVRHQALIENVEFTGSGSISNHTLKSFKCAIRLKA